MNVLPPAETLAPFARSFPPSERSSEGGGTDIKTTVGSQLSEHVGLFHHVAGTLMASL